MAQRKGIAELPIEAEEGFGWIVRLAGTEFEHVPSDTMEAAARSIIVMTEDGAPLAHPHAPHTDIRMIGGGRFSHWGHHLRFSTSDNSSPLLNGRRYELHAEEKWALLSTAPSESPAPGPDGPVAGDIEIYNLIEEAPGVYSARIRIGVLPQDAAWNDGLVLFEDGIPLLDLRRRVPRLSDLDPTEVADRTVVADLEKNLPRLEDTGDFLVFCRVVFFRTGDGSDPRSNGRRYYFRRPSEAEILRPIYRTENEEFIANHINHHYLGSGIEFRHIGNPYFLYLALNHIQRCLRADIPWFDDQEARVRYHSFSQMKRGRHGAICGNMSTVLMEFASVMGMRSRIVQFIGHVATEIELAKDVWCYFDPSHVFSARNGEHYYSAEELAKNPNITEMWDRHFGSVYFPTLTSYFAKGFVCEPLTSAAEVYPSATVMTKPFLRHGEGHCWLFSDSSLLLEPGSNADDGRSNLVIFEDGYRLGGANSYVDACQALGQGRFCHQGDTVFFSTSDNTDPNENGRRYIACLRRFLHRR